jgi:uncharacterized membrane protein YvlD (DUF360 family)
VKHVVALLIKFAMIAIVLWIVLGITTDLSFGYIMYLSIAVTILAYVIGDLLILSATNNVVATIADIVLALITIYLYNYLLDTQEISFWDALIAAAVIGVGEWFFHKYLSRKILNNVE